MEALNEVERDRLRRLRKHAGGSYEWTTPDGVLVSSSIRSDLTDCILIHTEAPALRILKASPGEYVKRLSEIEVWAVRAELHSRDSDHRPGCDLTHPVYESCLEPDTTRRDLSGTVYLIRGPNSQFKIGYTRGSVEHRFTAIQNASPEVLELVHCFPSNNCVAAEQGLHRQFAEKRVRGEWYRLTAEDVGWLKDVKEIEVE